MRGEETLSSQLRVELRGSCHVALMSSSAATHLRPVEEVADCRHAGMGRRRR